MEAITKAMLHLSVICYITGIMYNLVDFSYTQKVIRLTVVLYIITGMLSPLKNINFSYNDLEFSDALDINAVDFIIGSGKAQLEDNIKASLDEKNISYTDVNVHINKQSDNIAVNYIEIFGVPADKRRDVLNCVENTGTVIFGD